MGFYFITRNKGNDYSIEVHRDNGKYNETPLYKISGSSVQDLKERLINGLDALIASEDDLRGIKEQMKRMYWL